MDTHVKGSFFFFVLLPFLRVSVFFFLLMRIIHFFFLKFIYLFLEQKDQLG